MFGPQNRLRMEGVGCIVLRRTTILSECHRDPLREIFNDHGDYAISCEIWYKGHSLLAWIDEEGELKRLYVNKMLRKMLGDALLIDVRGPVLITGTETEEGELQSVPEEVVAELCQL